MYSVLERSTDFQIERRADGLILATIQDKQALVHLEIQSVFDANMDRRLLAYNILAAIENDYLPVMSCVIYLRDVGEVQHPPLVVTFPYGDEIIRFHYKYIEMHKIPAESLLNMGIVGLLPLVLLTQGGTEPPVVEEIIERLTVAQEKDLLTTTYSLGGLAFNSESGREWFRKRFKMLQETMGDNWVFQEIGSEESEE